MSAASRACRVLGELGQRHDDTDKRAAQLFLERTCSLWQTEQNGEVASILVTFATRKLPP